MTEPRRPVGDVIQAVLSVIRYDSFLVGPAVILLMPSEDPSYC